VQRLFEKKIILEEPSKQNQVSWRIFGCVFDDNEDIEKDKIKQPKVLINKCLHP
jgi:hypothetical protein